MTRSVPWRVEKVEASIAEEVEGREYSNFEVPVEFDLSHLMTTESLSTLIFSQLISATHAKSESSKGESCLVGYPGMKLSLNDGPTTISVLLGNRLASPM